MGVRRRGLAVVGGALALALPAEANAATIKVTSTADDLSPKCTLREAVDAANLNTTNGECKKGQAGERDVIVLKAKPYELTDVAGDIPVIAGGPLTIQGRTNDETSAETEISQTVDDRVFNVTNGSNLTIRNMEIEGNDVTDQGFDEGEGGVLKADAVDAKVTLRNLEIQDGVAWKGGGVFTANDVKLVIKNSNFGLNEAYNQGGGLLAVGEAPATIKRSTFFGNEASGASSQPAFGGALVNGVPMTITDSTFFGNDAEAGPGDSAQGGAISSNEDLDIKRSLFWSNATESADSSENGGAIYTFGGTNTVVNSTFHENVAGDDVGVGGALRTTNIGSTTFRFVTLAGNTAGLDGDSIATDDTHDFAIGRSIIDDSPTGTPWTGLLPDSTGFNVSAVDDADCGFVGSDLLGAGLDLAVDPDDNGGATETLKIGNASDAENFVPKNKCLSITDSEDQRGYKRPAGPKCDAGAYERGAKKP